MDEECQKQHHQPKPPMPYDQDGSSDAFRVKPLRLLEPCILIGRELHLLKLLRSLRTENLLRDGSQPAGAALGLQRSREIGGVQFPHFVVLGPICGETWSMFRSPAVVIASLLPMLSEDSVYLR